MARNRRSLVLLVAGATALLASACGSSLGGSTPCSTFMSMDNADQQSTITNMLHQWGETDPGSDTVSGAQRNATTYCSDPMPGVNTISGMLDSRAQ
jgi:hypothetical protein